MLNNLIFALSTLCIVLFAHICRRQGKEALFAWVALQSILANLFVLKQITLFGLNATASDMFAVGGILGLNLLQAEFGPQVAKKAVWTSFLCMIFFCLISQAHIHYLPSAYDHTQAAYATLLTPAPRILAGSLIAFFMVQQFDIFLFGKLKAWFPNWSFTRTTTLCLFISQGLDTILFAFLGLYGLVDQIWQIIFIAYTIKTLTIVLMMPLSHFSQRLGTLKT
jgi:queuosine precursor transporter